jgi:glycosyltransferase involved in cell wall biosynthesis
MGGAERVVLDLTKEYKKKNHTVYVMSLSSKKDLLDNFKEIGIDPVIFDFSRVYLSFPYLVCIIQFIRKKRVNIVHLHMVHPIILSPFIFCFTKAKIIFTPHSFNIGGATREFYTWLLKPFRHIDILFSKSQYKYFYKRDYQIIGNGIDIGRYNMSVAKHDIFTFIAVGRLEAVKNHGFLVDLMYRIIFIYKKYVQLIIVGSGNLQQSIENKINEHKLDNYIHLLGARNDVDILLSKSHCLLSPSLWEGMPITLLEAGASKIPIICTNVGSIASLLNKENSYICGIDDFEKNMLFVMDNYKESCRKAEILYQKIRDNFSLGGIADKHLGLYLSLLS